MGKKSGGCGCRDGSCSTCACSKKHKRHCDESCHGGAINKYCLNNPYGERAKKLSMKELRQQCGQSGLSPIGNKNDLMVSLIAYWRENESESKPKAENGTSSAASTGESVSGGASGNSEANKLISSILQVSSDYCAILSLSGVPITENTPTKLMRKAYLKLSLKIHPDKNRSNSDAKAAFQFLVAAFDRLSQPDLFRDDAEVKQKGPRKKKEIFKRGNENCYKTRIDCPRCYMTWGKAELGLEDAAYNFFMSGLKQYVCGRCACLFGCMTAIHYCPHCRQEYEYSADDYHKQICCGSTTGRCAKKPKKFGFYYHKVSQRRHDEVRAEVKREQEKRMKEAAAQNRRRKRAAQRVQASSVDEERKSQEILFLRGLLDECPRCGEILRPFKREYAEDHLMDCQDKKLHAKYRLEKAKAKAKKEVKQSLEEKQNEMMVEKQWEMNGRQVGQLWMLTEGILRRKCKEANLREEKDLVDLDKSQLISILGSHLRKKVLQIMDAGGSSNADIEADITGIGNVDAEDLPENLWAMEKEDLQAVCASYNVKFETNENKETLISRLERARYKGSQLMLADNAANEKVTKKKLAKIEAEDEDYDVVKQEKSPKKKKQRIIIDSDSD